MTNRNKIRKHKRIFTKFFKFMSLETTVDRVERNVY